MAADGLTVKVRNKDKLARKFAALAPEAHRELTRANYETAAAMVSTAQRFVPRRTGTLARTIHAEPAGTETGAVRVLAGGPATTKAARQGAGSYDYALGVEFGTSDTAAHPFFFTAYRLEKRRHRTRAGRALRSSTKKVAAK